MSTRRKPKYRKWVVLSVILIAVASLAGAYLLRTTPISYENVQAKIDDISTNYKFSGNVATKNRQIILSEKVMQVSKINYQEGDVVKEGDVLISTTTGDEIKAKIVGEIVNLGVEEGSQIMAGTALMEVVDYDNLEITIKVDEYDLAAVEKGQEAIVTIGAVQKELKGNLSSISKEGTVMNGVTFFTATIDLSQDTSLKAGMTAEVTLQDEQAVGVITLPMTAIQFKSDNTPYVLRKDQNNNIEKTEITTGINDGVTVEIKTGVAVGETIYYTKDVTTNDFRFGGRERD